MREPEQRRFKILSKNPPGGRCALYINYAEVLSECLNIPCEINYSNDEVGELKAPALVLDDQEINPGDCFMLSPEDLVRYFEKSLNPDEQAHLLQRLETVYNQLLNNNQ